MLPVVRVTNLYTNPDGSGVTNGGTVTFTLTAALIDVLGGDIHSVTAVTCKVATPGQVTPSGAALAAGELVGPDGERGVLLVSTDAPAANPHGVRYTVFERLVGPKSRRYTIPIPYDATIDPATGEQSIALSTLTPSVGDLVYVAVPGPPGSSGGSGAPFVFTQATPALQWVVNHNLGYRPAVRVMDVSWAELDVAVLHPSVDQFVVAADAAFAGFAQYR